MKREIFLYAFYGREILMVSGINIFAILSFFLKLFVNQKQQGKRRDLCMVCCQYGRFLVE
jgi:hypothetical protein